MRIAQPQSTTLQALDAGRMTYRARGGERFEIAILEHDVVRVVFQPEGSPRLRRTWSIVDGSGAMPREGRDRDDYTPFNRPVPTVTEQPGGTIVLRTAALSLSVNTADNLSLRWSDARGRLFAADQPQRPYAYDRHSRAVYHYLERRAAEHYYGFGEKSGPLDKQGRRMRMCSMDALGYSAATSDPLYKHFPFYITFDPGLNIAYGLLYDNHAGCVFDMGSERDNYYGLYRYYQADDGDVDYYMIYGPSVADVVRKLARLTGYPLLPPRWSLGFTMSAWSPSEMADGQARVEQIVDAFAANDFPCSTYQLSSGYTVLQSDSRTAGTDIRTDQRYVFHWNRARFPDPEGMAAHFARAGIRIAANVKPAMLTSHPLFEEVDSFGGFIQDGDTDGPYLAFFWGGDGAHLDFTNPVTYAWWQRQVTEKLLEKGIEVTWNDNNEYTLWDDDARCSGFGTPVRAALIRPVQGLLMTRASLEAQLAHKPGIRPFVICRTGTIGIQRYAQTWSGDNETSWETLRYNIPMGLGMSLSGAPSYGHDVGGLVGDVPGPEILARWVQNGIFHPRFTIHSWTDDGSYTAPWIYPETTALMRELFRFRYRLIPYLYALFFEAARSGVPMMRPMVYAFQHDPECHAESFDFMLGPNLLVATVMTPGARERSVYLPRLTVSEPGAWCNYHTGEWYRGGQTVMVPAPLEQIPLFVPAGGIIPFGKVIDHNEAARDDERQVFLFPPPGSCRSTFCLIDDDGVTTAYASGAYSELSITLDAHDERIDVTLRFVHRGYPLPYRELEFILPPGETRPLAAGGLGRDAFHDARGRRHYVVGIPE